MTAAGIMPPELAWGLFVRGLAAIYVIALVSLRAEILALCGSRGVSPLSQKLVHLRSELGLTGAIARHPSLFWLSSSDAAIKLLPIAGIITALLAMAGFATPWMLAVTWLIYLSLDIAVGMTFPWESLLYEAGFLAIFLPALSPAPDLAMTQAPPPFMLLAFLWLLFRVVFGFGKNKFTIEATGDPVYLRGFLISQPIPSPIAWRAFRLPRAALVASLGALFVVEMVMPFLVFVPGWPRLLAAAAFCGLMVSIQLMGNFGFFNLLVMVLCLPLFDARSIGWPWSEAPANPGEMLAMAAASWSLIAGLLHLPFNTFVARGWPEWPAWAAAPRPLRAIVAVLRGAMPFRTVHAYGVFPPRIGPPLKWLPVIEGTLDGETWRPYEYRFMPSTEYSKPRFVAPHTPRLDHFALYEGCGVGAGNYLGTIFSQGNPYDFTTATMLDRTLERLMDSASPVRRLFARDPFDGQPPALLRIRTYAFTPASAAERRSTGRYWHKDFVHEHAAPRPADPSIWLRWLPRAEQLHPDERWARRRIPRLAPLRTARDLSAVRGVLDADTIADWDAFWTGWLPRVRDAAASGWPAITGLAREMRTMLTPLAIDRLDRIRGAITTALLERMEPHLLGEPPVIDAAFYFHASLLAHAALLAGPEHVESLLREPSRAASTAPGFEQSGLMVLAVWRLEMLSEHAQTHRMMATFQLGDPPPGKAIPGFVHLMPVLAAALPDPEQRLPRLERTRECEWLIGGRLFAERRGA